MFIYENAPIEWMDKLLMYSVVGTIVGARLGHVIFYDPAYYLENISEIFMVWKGGLASHGAAIALIIAMWVFSKKVTKKHTLWSLDRLVIAVALAAGFIRIGNLMNSEIVGVKTNNEMGFFYEFKAKSQISGFFNIDKEKIKFDKTNSDTLIDNIYFPKIEVSIPLGNQKMNPYYSEAFSNAFDYKSIETDADFFSSSKKDDFSTTSLNEMVLPIYIIPRIPTNFMKLFPIGLFFRSCFGLIGRKNGNCIAEDYLGFF